MLFRGKKKDDTIAIIKNKEGIKLNVVVSDETTLESLYGIIVAKVAEQMEIDREDIGQWTQTIVNMIYDDLLDGEDD